MVKIIEFVHGKPELITDILLAEFGYLGRVLSASSARLHQTIPFAPAVVEHLAFLRSMMMHSFQCEVAQGPVIANSNDLLEYLKADMAHLLVERVRILHLNARNMLLRDEVMSEGTIDESQVYIREVIRRAIELGSTGIIVAHNHPSGDVAPSRADIDVTRRLAEAGKWLRISLHDHIIIGADGHSSLRALGLL